MTFTNEELDYIIKFEPSEVTSSLARELKRANERIPSIEANYKELLDTYTVYVVEATKDYVTLVNKFDTVRAKYLVLLEKSVPSTEDEGDSI